MGDIEAKDMCRSCLGYGGGFDIDGDPSPEPCQDCGGSGTRSAPVGDIEAIRSQSGVA